MIVWSLSTITDWDCDLETRLYLSQRQAYEALARFLFGEDAAEDADPVKLDILLKLTEREIDAAAIAIFDEYLSDSGITAVVTEHEHPWTFV